MKKKKNERGRKYCIINCSIVLDHDNKNKKNIAIESLTHDRLVGPSRRRRISSFSISFYSYISAIIIIFFFWPNS